MDEDIAGVEKGEGDAPLIDLNEASIKKLIARAKRRGVITYDELNEALPQDQMSSEQIEDIMAAISEMGVNIVENDEDAADPEDKASRGRSRRSRCGGRTPRPHQEEGNHRAHRRSGADVPARDGRGRIAQPRGRNRHCQAHRGWPRHDDPGAVRKPDHLSRDHPVVRSAERGRNATARDSRSRCDAVEGAAARKPDRRRRSRRRRRDQRIGGRPLLQGRRRSRGRARCRATTRTRTAIERRAPSPGRGRGRG